MRFLLITCALLALAGCGKPAKIQPQGNEAADAAETGGIKGVHRENKGKPAPDAAFKDPDGAETTLAELQGKPLLVNFWASWCAPCVKELPTLDKLSRTNPALKVAAISQDNGPHASVVAFLEKHQAGNLDPYQDPAMALAGAIGVEVMPTSVLYDAKGREVWRYVGDLDWTGPEAAKLLAEAGAAPKP
ncbi:MAG: redoxin family protein [Pseudomonadota bacterium]